MCSSCNKLKMKRRSSLSIKVAVVVGAALGLLACSSQGQRERQCKGVVETYIQLQNYTAQRLVVTAQTWRLDLDFSVPSALGPQPGQASCEYRLAEDGGVADKPYAITLGNTRHTGAENIDDLLTGRFADGLPADFGHHH